MADHNPTDRVQRAPLNPAEEERMVEWAVLAFLLDEHPDPFTIPELCRYLNAGSLDFGKNDAVERAVRELVCDGLLHCRGGFVQPTRAALSFKRRQH